MADQLFQVERHGSYATFTLNRPEKRNSLNEPMLKALDEAVASVEDDKSIRAVIHARQRPRLLLRDRFGGGRTARRRT